MRFEPLSLDGAFLIHPVRHGDARGFFSEVFRHDLFSAAIPGITFVQDNHSLSGPRGTLRGLHFQKAPRAQGKLVRVTRGAVLDVIVDIRHGSKTFGQHLGVELSAENWTQLWVPAGFLHGFCTLTENVEFLYKVTAPYSAEHDAGIAFDDPDLQIQWPFPREALTISAKDAALPRLKDLPPLF